MEVQGHTIVRRRAKDGNPGLDGKPGADGKPGKDANLLPWVEQWNNNKTLIGGEYVVSPKMFSGTNTGTSENPILTGIAMGKDCLTMPDESKRTGIFALVNNEIVFELDPTSKKYKFTGEVNATSGVFQNVTVDGNILNIATHAYNSGNTILIDSSIGYYRKLTYKVDKVFKILSCSIQMFGKEDIIEESFVLPYDKSFVSSTIMISNLSFPPYTRVMGSFRYTIVKCEEGGISGFETPETDILNSKDPIEITFINGHIELIGLPIEKLNYDTNKYDIIGTKWAIKTINALDITPTY